MILKINLLTLSTHPIKNIIKLLQNRSFYSIKKQLQDDKIKRYYHLLIGYHNVSIYIDYVEVVVPANYTILIACITQGEVNSCFCRYKNDQRKFNCNLCKVKIVESQKIVLACKTLVFSGMCILTTYPFQDLAKPENYTPFFTKDYYLRSLSWANYVRLEIYGWQKIVLACKNFDFS